MLKKIWNRITRPVLLDLGTCEDAIVLAGTGRSGTTWVANIINYDNAYRLLFEPFYPERVPRLRHFKFRQYLRPDNRERDFVAPMRAVLSGRVRNAWINQHNHRWVSHQRLIKAIRANLSLKWIKVNYPEIPIVLLLRHPCAVAHSRLKLGWGAHLEVFLQQERLVQDHLAPFKTEIENAQSDFEKQIFLWCIETYVPLQQFSDQEIHLAFYETFCTEPEQEIRRLFSFLGRAYQDAVLREVRRPSAVSRKDSAIRSGESLIETWREHITTAQLHRAMDIVRRFGLHWLYGEASSPLIARDQPFPAP